MSKTISLSLKLASLSVFGVWLTLSWPSP